MYYNYWTYVWCIITFWYRRSAWNNLFLPPPPPRSFSNWDCALLPLYVSFSFSLFLSLSRVVCNCINRGIGTRLAGWFIYTFTWANRVAGQIWGPSPVGSTRANLLRKLVTATETATRSSPRSPEALDPISESRADSKLFVFYRFLFFCSFNYQKLPRSSDICRRHSISRLPNQSTINYISEFGINRLIFSH